MKYFRFIIYDDRKDDGYRYLAMAKFLNYKKRPQDGWDERMIRCTVIEYRKMQKLKGVA